MVLQHQWWCCNTSDGPARAVMLLQQQQGQGLPQNQRTPTKKAIISIEEPARQARYGIMGPFWAQINQLWAHGAHNYLFWGPLYEPGPYGPLV